MPITALGFAMIQMIVDLVPSAIMFVDSKNKLTNLFISGRPLRRSKKFVGKNFFRMISRILGKTSVDEIKAAYWKCYNDAKSTEIKKMSYVNIYGAYQFYNWQFRFFPEYNGVIIYVRDITESILLEQEFTSVCQQFEATNRELCAAMSNLDLKLMDLDQAHKKLQSLYRITSITQKSVRQSEIFQELVNNITNELGFDNAAILLFDDQKTDLLISAHKGYKNDKIRIKLGNGITGQAALHRELIYCPDVSKDPRYIPGTVDAVGEIAVPLIVDDNIIGVLDVEFSYERQITSYDLDLLRSLAGQVALIIVHANQIAKVEKEAITDGLTGLYNYRYFRTLLEKEIKRALRYNHSIALLMIDIDFFKNYNDTFGHLAGDQVLKQVGALIKQSCRDIDLVARYGGEEFAVLLPETVKLEASLIAERIRSNIAQYPFPYMAMQPGGRITVSIGLASCPHDASSDRELIDFADAALYTAKRSTKNCVQAYGIS